MQPVRHPLAVRPPVGHLLFLGLRGTETQRDEMLASHLDAQASQAMRRKHQLICPSSPHQQ